MDIENEIETGLGNCGKISPENWPSNMQVLRMEKSIPYSFGYVYKSEYMESTPVSYRILFKGVLICISNAIEYARRNLNQWSISIVSLEVNGRVEYSRDVPTIHIKQDATTKRLLSALEKYVTDNKTEIEKYYARIDGNRNNVSATESNLLALCEIDGVRRDGKSINEARFDSTISVYGRVVVYRDSVNLEISSLPLKVAEEVLNLISLRTKTEG